MILPRPPVDSLFKGGFSFNALQALNRCLSAGT